MFIQKRLTFAEGDTLASPIERNVPILVMRLLAYRSCDNVLLDTNCRLRVLIADLNGERMEGCSLPLNPVPKPGIQRSVCSWKHLRRRPNVAEANV